MYQIVTILWMLHGQREQVLDPFFIHRVEIHMPMIENVNTPLVRDVLTPPLTDFLPIHVPIQVEHTMNKHGGIAETDVIQGKTEHIHIDTDTTHNLQDTSSHRFSSWFS